MNHQVMPQTQAKTLGKNFPYLPQTDGRWPQPPLKNFQKNLGGVSVWFRFLHLVTCSISNGGQVWAHAGRWRLQLWLWSRQAWQDACIYWYWNSLSIRKEGRLRCNAYDCEIECHYQEQAEEGKSLRRDLNAYWKWLSRRRCDAWKRAWCKQAKK